jgi:ADP-heptose:LPS heptosyltransferase
MNRTLVLKGSLGDHVVYTGLPEAFYKIFGIKLFVESSYSPLWRNNPFIASERLNDVFKMEYEQIENEWNTYKPRRVFMQMTGVDPEKEGISVCPKLYRSRNTEPDLIVVNNEAGWPSRRGLLYWDLLSKHLKQKGFKVISLRTPTYKDCTGQIIDEPITIFDKQFINPTLETVIDLLSCAKYYIGYESAYAHIAGALEIEYVLFLGSLPEICIKHPSCKLVVSGCVSPCHKELCEKQCLSTINYETIGKILELLIL